ncbi:response regulator [Mucilaginibacter lappiensis]|uniref:response regulator n=1 Tax=Mucilaginibacter lappiensis TaxID=354630 RepID=UPI003D224AE9
MKKILLLDDNLDIIQIVEEVLTYEQFHVQSTTKSAEFVSIAEKYRPDLFLLDFRLNDGNGGDLCRALKAHTSLKHIPVIIFSAYFSPNVDFSDFGCDEVISKPFDLDVLVQTVQRLIEQSMPANSENS